MPGSISSSQAAPRRQDRDRGRCRRREAWEFYVRTYHGRLGQRFKMLSEYAVRTLASEQLKERNHTTSSSTSMRSWSAFADRKVLLVRAEYVERGAREGGQDLTLPVQKSEKKRWKQT